MQLDPPAPGANIHIIMEVFEVINLYLLMQRLSRVFLSKEMCKFPRSRIKGTLFIFYLLKCM
jgi:hypothetical protein